MTDGNWLLHDQNARVYLRVYDIVAEAGASLAISLYNRKHPHVSIRRALNRFGLAGGSEG
ncbi:hypothetical protein [Mesorhizobium caraganae]|uniref:hypothetical protein n=1 Tax=Mesorhizobium caraganae TaxID=483206 RepID=UPI003ECE428A